MYTLINGSQKNKKSNSQTFLEYVSEYLDEYNIYNLNNSKYEDVINNTSISSAIVLAFPLYADSPTSLMLSFLDYIYDLRIKLKNISVYAIINCGFLEGEQNITANNIIKNWCIKVGADYKGSILIGAGEIVGNKNFRFISKNAYKELRKFSICVNEDKECGNIITTMDILNNKLYCMLANHSWTKKGKKNKLNKKSIKTT